MNDEELGLPTPKRYEGEFSSIEEYFTEEYSDAQTLEEAIALRGAKAFFKNVNPEDFLNVAFPGFVKIGIADLWADSTWEEGMSERNVDLEKLAASLKEGDLFEVRPWPENIHDWSYGFHLINGSMLPYTPYHDYDDQFFENALETLRVNEKIICRVRKVSCYGENGIKCDPEFCWRVYVCSVTVYRVDLTKACRM